MSTSASSGFAELLRAKLAGLLELTPEQVAALQAHYELLLRWNQRLNLTRVDSLEQAVERHYCESLFLAKHLGLIPLRICDIGSGAGFPGIPIAIARPDCTITLIESHKRKAVFLREASRKLPNVRVLTERAEDVSESFDCAVSRAVSYQDLVPVLRKLAGSADLLTGAEEPPVILCFTWNKGIVLPWNRSSFLRIGQAVDVSRETSC